MVEIILNLEKYVSKETKSKDLIAKKCIHSKELVKRRKDFNDRSQRYREDNFISWSDSTFFFIKCYNLVLRLNKPCINVSSSLAENSNHFVAIIKTVQNYSKSSIYSRKPKTERRQRIKVDFNLDKRDSGSVVSWINKK